MQMTDLEKRVLEAWAAEMPGVRPETHLDLIRQRMKETAYHEAGHAAVTAFFGDDHSHFVRITIIPTGAYLGVFRRERILKILGGDYSRFEWIRGHKTLFYLLGGRMAEGRIGGDVLPIVDAVMGGMDQLCFFDSWDPEDESEAEKEWRQSTDEGKALEVAELLSKPQWPAFRILEQAEKRTGEILELPAVWGTVERIAQRLLDVGTIDDFDEYHGLVADLLFTWPNYRKWRRWMKITPDMLSGA
jgi:hypothetical protein